MPNNYRPSHYRPWLWSEPYRAIRWAAHEKPAIFFSCIIGITGPILLATLPPFRRALGDYDPAPIPMSYPIPSGPRQHPKGYEDE